MRKLAEECVEAAAELNIIAFHALKHAKGQTKGRKNSIRKRWEKAKEELTQVRKAVKLSLS